MALTPRKRKLAKLPLSLAEQIDKTARDSDRNVEKLRRRQDRLLESLTGEGELDALEFFKVSTPMATDGVQTEDEDSCTLSVISRRGKTIRLLMTSYQAVDMAKDLIRLSGQPITLAETPDDDPRPTTSRYRMKTKRVASGT